jgi:hypothetical protein
MKIILIFILSLINGLAWSSDEQVEIHATLCPSSPEELLIQLNRESTPPKTRDVWYLDYNNLSLNDSGKILRVRKNDNKDKVSVTVKLRGEKELGFRQTVVECEKDWYGDEQKSSCSLDSSVLAQQWESTLQGELPLVTLFSSPQLHFLSNSATDIHWEKLKILGVIKVQIWKFNDKTLEFWSMSSHKEHLKIFEISIRAPKDKAMEAQRTLYRDLDELNVKLCSDHSSKTRTALEFLSQKLGFEGAPMDDSIQISK